MRLTLPSLPNSASPARGEWLSLAALVALAALVRLAMILALDTPVVSDAEAYLTMVRTILDGSGMRDHYGNAAFYSPGYPFFLAPFMLVFGATAGVGQAVNLALACASTAMIWAIGRRVSGLPAVGLLAAAGFALLIPAAVGTEALGREPLSTVLLLASVLVWLRLPGSAWPWPMAVISGMVYAAMLLTGASAVLTAAGFALAAFLRRATALRHLALVAVFALATIGTLAPWLAHVRATIGVTTLTTNGPFNLYLGNNPAADGRFISIAKTPIGPIWHETRTRLGEAGTARLLGDEAKAYILAHPRRTAELALAKLAGFWMPNIPDANDDGGIVRVARLLDVAQYLLFVALALLSVRGWRAWNAGHAILIVTVAGFWAIHAAAYVMPRYREPIMPLLLVFAAIGLVDLARRVVPKRTPATLAVERTT